MRPVLGWVGQVVSWLVILGVCAVLAVAVLVPRLAGATPYTVLTGSMQPDLPPGTLVVVEPIAPEDIRSGDVITYQLESGKPAVVTHRVTAVGSDLTGEPVFTTQGDANDVPDEKPVRPVQIKGKLWYAVPHLGRVNTWLSGNQRQLGVYAVAGGLALYALAQFFGAWRDRRRRAPEEDAPEDDATELEEVSTDGQSPG